MSEQVFEQLELQIDRLIARCQELHQTTQSLKAENEELRETIEKRLRRENEWKSERAQLRQTRDNTQAKIEAMINRLKAMEQQ